MYNNEKVYAIDLGEDLVIEREHGEPAETGSSSAKADAPISKNRLVLRSRKGGAGRKAGKKAPRRLHFALLLPMVFLAGPLAVLLTPEGREKRDWVVVALIMGGGWLAAAIAHAPLVELMKPGRFQVPAMVMAVTLLLGGFTAWARGVALAGGENRPADHRLPLAMRRAWGTGILGLLAPGMGLLAAGRNRRAAAVVWMGWLPLASLLFLYLGADWWPGRVPSPGFEKTLLVSGLVAGLAALGWIVQALEGARLVPWEGYRYHSRRGEILGLVAVLGILVLVFAGDPSPFARHLGRQARELRADGYRVIPLAMVRTAGVLDPGRTDYAVMEMGILEDMGRRAPAAELRHRLESDLASYLTMVRDEEEIREEARRTAEMLWTAEATVPMGWFPPDPFLDTKNPEASASGSILDE